MKMFEKALIVFLILLSVSEAGILISYKDEKDNISEVSIDKNYIRLGSPKALNQYLIFNKERQILTQVAKESYTEMTKENLAELSDKMNIWVKKMHDAMAKAANENVTNIYDADTKLKYIKIRPGEKFNNITCSVYEGYKGKSKMMEVWTSDKNSLGLNAEEAAVIESISNFYGGISMGFTMLNIGSENLQKTGEGYNGFPIRVIQYNFSGKIVKCNEMVKSERKAFPYSMFEIPKEYKEVKFQLNIPK